MRERKHLEGPAGRITWHARTFFAGNREISHLTSRCIRLVRIGQAKSSSRREKSDSAILAVKVPTYGEDFLGLSYRFRPESRTHVRAVTPRLSRGCGASHLIDVRHRTYWRQAVAACTVPRRPSVSRRADDCAPRRRSLQRMLAGRTTSTRKVPGVASGLCGFWPDWGCSER
jgi:hypothetical protein